MRKNWHTLSPEDALRALRATKQGLEEAAAARRLETHGKNVLPEEERRSLVRLFLSQFNNPLVYILLIACAVSLYLRHYADVVFILAVLVINTGVGFYQERKADASLRALKKIVTVSARVIRGGDRKQIDSAFLVPGDIVELRAGDKVPADMRLLEVRGLRVNESALTGEWVAVQKRVPAVSADAPLGERASLAFMGTLVEEGEGVGVVAATGRETEFGTIVELLKSAETPRTPLQKRLARLSKIAGAFVLTTVIAVVGIGIYRGQPFADIFVASLALAVSATPAGLLPAITVILVLGMKRILHARGLVRTLSANETLGSVTVIATDKTGTLTEGKMQVSHILASRKELISEESGIAPREINGGAEGHLLALKIAAATSDAFIENPDDELRNFVVRGRPTEQAFLIAAAEAGLRQKEIDAAEPVLARFPFNSVLKLSASVRKRADGARVLYAAGAAEAILSRSRAMHDGNAELHEAEREQVTRKLDTLACKGLRLIACAYRELPRNAALADVGKLLHHLVLVGVVALKDPLRKEARDSVMETKRAGIRTILITGDHRGTAETIAREVGIDGARERVLEGVEIDALSDKELQQRVKTVTVFARVSPAHKLRIVAALQANKEVVAMLGDGVNDVPALKAADVGVAVGAGTDVAKEVADVVLLDNNFATMVKAIEQGRVVFQNIRKVFVYLIADDFSELVLFLAAMALGLPLPLVAAQILWINLVEDGFPSVALTTEQETAGVMREPPRRPDEPILNAPVRNWMVSILIITGLAAFLLFVGFWQWTGSVEKARAMTFALMCLDSLIFAYSVRSFKRPILRRDIFGNRFLNAAALFGLALLVAAIYLPPLQTLLHTAPFSVLDWLAIATVSIIEITLLELAKKRFFRPVPQIPLVVHSAPRAV